MKYLLCIFFILAIVLTPALAEQERKKKKTFALTKAVYERITVINEKIDEKAFDEAIELLDKLGQRKLSIYERAQMHYLKGMTQYQIGELESAYNSFENVIVEPDKIAELLNTTTLRTLTQLGLGLEYYEKTLVYAERLVLVSANPESDYALLARVHYKTTNFEEARKAVEKAVNIVLKADKLPKENLLLLQNAIYYELKLFEAMLTPLGALAKHYPKTSYILYLSSVYGQLGKQADQTVLMESLYESNQLTRNSELVNLASLYIAEKVPYKGALVLEKGIKDGIVEQTRRNYELLSQAWLLSAESDNAIASLGNAAALAEDGELYLRQAYLNFDRYNWKATLTSVKNALDKAFENKELFGEAYVLEAMVYANLKNYEQALDACRRAMKYPESEKFAKQWFKYIESEQEKQIKMSM